MTAAVVGVPLVLVAVPFALSAVLPWPPTMPPEERMLAVLAGIMILGAAYVVCDAGRARYLRRRYRLSPYRAGWRGMMRGRFITYRVAYFGRTSLVWRNRVISGERRGIPGNFCNVVNRKQMGRAALDGREVSFVGEIVREHHCDPARLGPAETEQFSVVFVRWPDETDESRPGMFHLWSRLEYLVMERHSDAYVAGEIKERYADARAGGRLGEPWDTLNPEIIAAWSAITAPEQLTALEFRAREAELLDEQGRRWLEQALADCRRRADETRGA
jgi:hypothetical protein